MATGTGGSGESSLISESVVWIDPERFRPDGTDGEDAAADPSRPSDPIDLDRERHALCHACGHESRFRGLLCDDCRRRHRV